jgi:nickel-dependent lactate racemase
MKGLTTHPQVLEKFEKMGFQTGPHKAYQIALQAIHKRIILVSSMEKETVQSLILEPAMNVDEAYQMAAQGNPDLSIALLPKATSTIPVLLEQ